MSGSKRLIERRVEPFGRTHVHHLGEIAQKRVAGGAVELEVAREQAHRRRAAGKRRLAASDRLHDLAPVARRRLGAVGEFVRGSVGKQHHLARRKVERAGGPAHPTAT